MQFRLLLVKFAISTGGCPLLTHSIGLKPWIQDHEIWPEGTRNIALPYGGRYMYVSTSWTVRRGLRVWRTDDSRR